MLTRPRGRGGEPALMTRYREYLSTPGLPLSRAMLPMLALAKDGERGLGG